MFTLDEKQYDETKMSDKGKMSYVNIQNISNRRNQLAMEVDNLNVLEQHYVAILKEELPDEIKEEEKEE
jgi:hypothetical protein